jgi:hypothetical protein
LPIVIEVVEHQVEVVVDLLCQVINDSFFTVNNDLHVILLYHGAPAADYSRPTTLVVSTVLRAIHIIGIGGMLSIHVVAEGAWLGEMRRAL